MEDSYLIVGIAVGKNRPTEAEVYTQIEQAPRKGPYILNSGCFTDNLTSSVRVVTILLPQISLS